MLGCLVVPVTKTHFPAPKSKNGFLRNPPLQKTNLFSKGRNASSFSYLRRNKKRLKRANSSSSSSCCSRCVVCGLFPVDPWSPTIDSESIASQLFAASLFPYLGFLYFITKSKSAPKLTLFGFYFLLAFVGATIPAGIYAKVHYGTSLSNVDWLHGSAESLLTLTNLFIVLGLREALRKVKNMKDSTSNSNAETKEEKQPST